MFAARFPLLVKDVKMDGDAFDPYTVDMLRMTTSRLMSGRKSLAHDVINQANNSPVRKPIAMASISFKSLSLPA